MRWPDLGWETFPFDVDMLSAEDHEIGFCLACGKYDWYSNLSEYDCECADCEADRKLVW